jgi:hypothetical protein
MPDTKVQWEKNITAPGKTGVFLLVSGLHPSVKIFMATVVKKKKRRTAATTRKKKSSPRKKNLHCRKDRVTVN